MAENFADRLTTAIEKKGAAACVGIDPRVDLLPDDLRCETNDLEAAVDAVLSFGRDIIDLVAPHVAAIKLQSAYFEALHVEGVEAYYSLVEQAHHLGLVVIGDVKRNDIGSTAEAYATAHLNKPIYDAVTEASMPDAITVNGYFGIDGVSPFIKCAASEGRGVFILARTSNPSATITQDVLLQGGKPYFQYMAEQIGTWAADPQLRGNCGYSSVGAVVGGTAPQQAAVLRETLPHLIFLVPGYGVQGASVEQVRACFKGDGGGAIVNASRSVIYAYRDQPGRDWKTSVSQAAKDFHDQISGIQ